MIFHPVSRYRRKRVGAHLVEFAFVIPVFFIFIFGLVEIGRGLMVSSLVTNAARAGCRVGIVPSRTNTDVTGAVDGLLKAQGLSGYTTTIQVNGATADVSSAQSADMVTVNVTISPASASWLPTLSFLKNNISGQFTMPHE